MAGEKTALHEAYEIEPLPYPDDALEPVISARTLSIHYGKHHRGYLDKLNAATEGRPQAQGSLEELIRSADGDLFNHAAQVWNHSFYWRSLKPGGGGKPQGALADAVEAGFGSLERLKHELAEAAKGEFGSGWAWLVVGGDGRLRVQASSDAENPLQGNRVPLLTIDVWEHAYYLDHQNDRAAYVEGVIEHLLDWDFAARNLGA